MTNNQLTDLRTLILSEVGDFFAGVGSPGEPGTPEEMQRELSMRLGRILNNHIVNYPRCEALVGILRECRIARDEAQAELQERRKAERDSELVYQYRIRNGYNGQVTEWQTIRRDQVDFVMKAQPLNAEFQVIAVPQPAPERDQVRREHAEWSRATFGNVGPIGPLKHLSKEALEAAAAPDDLSEWADMQFLLWDAQRRAGITDEQITQAMIEKLAVNKQRSWPEPKDGEPRLHIKEQSAPVATGETAYSGVVE